MGEAGSEAEWPRRWVECWEAGPGDVWYDWAAKRQELCADAAKAGDPQPFGLRPPKSFRVVPVSHPSVQSHMSCRLYDSRSSDRRVASLLRGSEEWEAGKAFPLAAVCRESPCGRTAQSQKELCWLVELTPDTRQDLGLVRGRTAWDACPDMAPITKPHFLWYDGRTGRSIKKKPVLLKYTLELLHVNVAVLDHPGRLCRRIYSLRERSEPGAEPLGAGKYALYHLRYENLAAEPAKWNLRLGGRKVSLEDFVRTRPSFLAKFSEAVKQVESLPQDPSSGSGASSLSGGEAGSMSTAAGDAMEGLSRGVGLSTSGIPPSDDEFNTSQSTMSLAVAAEELWAQCWLDCVLPKPGDEWDDDWGAKMEELRTQCRDTQDSQPFAVRPPAFMSLIVSLLKGQWKAGQDFPLACVAEKSPTGRALTLATECCWLIELNEDSRLDLGLSKNGRIWDAAPPGGRNVAKCHTRYYDAISGRALKKKPALLKATLEVAAATITPLKHGLVRRILYLKERPQVGAEAVVTGVYVLYHLKWDVESPEPFAWSITVKGSAAGSADVFVRTRPSFLAKSAAKVKELGSFKLAWTESGAQGAVSLSNSSTASSGEADDGVDETKLGRHLSGTALRHAWKKMRYSEGLSRQGTGGLPPPHSDSNILRKKERQTKSDREGEERNNKHEASDVKELMEEDEAVPVQALSDTSQSSAIPTEGLDAKYSLLSEEEQSKSVGFPESESGRRPESWAEEKPAVNPFRPSVSAQPRTAHKLDAYFPTSDQTPSCPLCKTEVPKKELETHLRKEIDYFPFRCSLCDCEFVDWPTAKAHFGGRFSLHRSVRPRLTEEREALKEQRLEELLNHAGL